MSEQIGATEWFGAAVKRKEDPALLRGEGHFVDDISARRACCTRRFVRSPHAHAKIRGIDTARGARAAGRACACSRYADLPEAAQRQTDAAAGAEPGASSSRSCRSAWSRTRRAMPASRSRCVVADTPLYRRGRGEPGRGRLRAAAGGRRDCLAAIEPGAPLAHAGTPNRTSRRAFRSTTATTTRRSPRRAHVFSEKICTASRRAVLHGVPRAGRGRTTPATDAFTVYVSSQGPHRHQAHADRRARSERQPAARGHARCRRRLRAQGRASIPNTRASRVAAQALRPAGEMDRGPAREFPRHASGARPVLGRRDRGRREREDPRPARPHDPRRPARICRGASCCRGSRRRRCRGRM